MITTLEEKTGLTLALGDIKTLLMHVSGKHSAEEVFAGADLQKLAEGNILDQTTFNPY